MVEYDDLSEAMQEIIAKLQVEVHELRFEINIYRWVSLVVLYFVGERIYYRFF
jgi:hypothetical protein